MSSNILPGIKPVLELLHSSPQAIRAIYCRDDLQRRAPIELSCLKNNIPFFPVKTEDLDALCKRKHTAHQGLLAMLAENAQVSLPDLLAQATGAPLPLILALDQVQDPGNLGTLSRTAWALGCAGIIMPEHNSASIGAAAYKTSAGALTMLPVCRINNLAKALDKAEEAGFTIYGTSGSQAASPVFGMEWTLPAVLVLGNENKGIRPGVAKRCKTMLKIPFARPFDSLNIAQAGAIFIGLCAESCKNAR